MIGRGAGAGAADESIVMTYTPPPQLDNLQASQTCGCIGSGFSGADVCQNHDVDNSIDYLGSWVAATGLHFRIPSYDMAVN